jgi:hypothetical protein
MSAITSAENGLDLASEEAFNLLLTPEEIREEEKQDKIKAAYHEAGHAVVAISLGSNLVRANITPTHTNQPWGERQWIGSCSRMRDPKEAPHVIGIAGVVAEAILANEWDENFGDYLDLTEISESDAEHLTESNCDEASFRAYHILHRQWDFVVRVADALISEESLTDWQILQMKEVKP